MSSHVRKSSKSSREPRKTKSSSKKYETGNASGYQHGGRTITQPLPQNDDFGDLDYSEQEDGYALSDIEAEGSARKSHPSTQEQEYFSDSDDGLSQHEANFTAPYASPARAYSNRKVDAVKKIGALQPPHATPQASSSELLGAGDYSSITTASSVPNQQNTTHGYNYGLGSTSTSNQRQSPLNGSYSYPKYSAPVSGADLSNDIGSYGSSSQDLTTALPPSNLQVPLSTTTHTQTTYHGGMTTANSTPYQYPPFSTSPLTKSNYYPQGSRLAPSATYPLSSYSDGLDAQYSGAGRTKTQWQPPSYVTEPKPATNYSMPESLASAIQQPKLSEHALKKQYSRDTLAKMAVWSLDTSLVTDLDKIGTYSEREGAVNEPKQWEVVKSKHVRPDGKFRAICKLLYVFESQKETTDKWKKDYDTYKKELSNKIKEYDEHVRSRRKEGKKPKWKKPEKNSQFEKLKNSLTYSAGTGWLVDSKTIATAGHCVWNHEDRDDKGHVVAVYAYIGINGALNGEDVQRIKGKYIAVHWGFYKNDEQHQDLAFIELDAPFKEPGIPFCIQEAPLSGNFNIRVVGYPGFFGYYMHECTEKKLDFKQLKSRSLRYKLDTDKGQSGGPVMIETDVGVKVVAVHTRAGPAHPKSGTSNENLVSYNNGVKLELYGNLSEIFRCTLTNRSRGTNSGLAETPVGCSHPLWVQKLTCVTYPA